MSTALLNHAALKRYILARATIKLPHWDCQRVSGEAITFYESFLASRLQHLVRNACTESTVPGDDDSTGLLIRSTVRRKLLELLQDTIRWAKIVHVEDDALDHLEGELIEKIDKDLKFHPTGVKTFKP